MDEGEAFMKLWFTPPSSDFTPYIQGEKTFLEESYVFRSFRSEFEVDKCFTKNCLKAAKEADDKNSYSASTRFEDFIPGYSALSYLPKKSVFSRQEMNDCYEIVLLLSNFKTLTLEQQEKLNFYKERMAMEQMEYLSLAKSQWMRENYIRHKEIMPEIETFINQLWQTKLERVKTYPKFYSQCCLVSLCPNIEDSIEFNFCSQLKKIGKLPQLFLPNLRFVRLNINHCVESVRRWRVEGKEEMSSSLGRRHGYHPQVSQDRVAEEVAVASNADLVLSASAFLCLVDNHRPDFLSTWDLPVTVKEFTSDCGVKQKIVFIDKKFPSRSMNQNERKNWYCKMACDNRVRNKTGVKRCSKTVDWDQQAEECSGGGAVDEQVETSSDLYNTRDEEFTSSDQDSAANPSLPSACPRALLRDISDTDSDANSLCIDLGDDPVQSVSQSTSRFNLTLAAQNSSTTYDINNAPQTNNVGKAAVKKVKHFESVSYNLWKLHKATSSYLSKNVSRDLNIIVRCKEGHLSSKVGEDGKKKRELYKVMSKLEYQPEYGAEQVSLSELTRQWASILIRPGAHLARMRVNPLDGDVIMYDKMSLSNLSCEGQRLYGVQLKECLASFHSVVGRLTELPPGQYYIVHKPVNSAFAPLYKATCGMHEVSLSSSFNVSPKEVAPERASWNPLDVNIISPTFKHFHRVPAMFTPSKTFTRTANVEKCFTVNQKNKKGKKKRNKGKKKKAANKKNSTNT